MYQIEASSFEQIKVLLKKYEAQGFRWRMGENLKNGKLLYLCRSLIMRLPKIYVVVSENDKIIFMSISKKDCELIYFE